MDSDDFLALAVIILLVVWIMLTNLRINILERRVRDLQSEQHTQTMITRPIGWQPTFR